ncbi:MAG: hypothetical protein ACR2LV_05555 [Solirubrobacteraceae bacterium]
MNDTDRLNAARKQLTWLKSAIEAVPEHVQRATASPPAEDWLLREAQAAVRAAQPGRLAPTLALRVSTQSAGQTPSTRQRASRSGQVER